MTNAATIDREAIGRKGGGDDFDGSNGWYYLPADLDNPMLLSQSGLEPSESTRA